MSSVHGSAPWRTTILSSGKYQHTSSSSADVLRAHEDARPGNARVQHDRDVELHALGVDRVHLLVVDRHLRDDAGPPDVSRDGALVAHEPDEVPDGLHAGVRVHVRDAGEAVGVLLHARWACSFSWMPGIIIRMPCSSICASTSATGSRQLLVLGHALEHVLRRHLHGLRLGVHGLLADVVVDLRLLGARRRHREERVDHATRAGSLERLVDDGRVAHSSCRSLVELEDPDRVLAEELGPHVVTERARPASR